MTVPDGWTAYVFSKTIVKIKINKSNQINTSAIKPKGKHPVIDQGRDYIAGYSDETNRVYKPERPLIVFGDHTRCFKYVDFPFIIGADGTKVLAPNTTLFNPKFYYYQLLHLPIPSRGYNRHYKLLKEQRILCPPMPEQDSIARILSQIQSAIEIQDQIIKTSIELKRTLMKKLLTDGLYGESKEKTEMGFIPKSWKVTTIKEKCRIGTGGTPNTKIKEYYNPPEINWLKSGDIKGLYITQVTNKISKLGKENSNANTLHPSGSVMMALSGRGKTRGMTAILGVASTCSQSVAAIIPEEGLCSEFLHFSLQSRYFEIRNITGHTDRSGLNLGLIGKIKIFIPPMKEQKAIARVFVRIEKKIQITQYKQEIMKILFKTMLHKLMTGQVKVNDLKLT